MCSKFYKLICTCIILLLTDPFASLQFYRIYDLCEPIFSQRHLLYYYTHTDAAVSFSIFSKSSRKKESHFLTPHPLRLRKVLLCIRSSSANHRNIQLRLHLDSAKLHILQYCINMLLEGSA